MGWRTLRSPIQSLAWASGCYRSALNSFLQHPGYTVVSCVGASLDARYVYREGRYDLKLRTRFR